MYPSQRAHFEALSTNQSQSSKTFRYGVPSGLSDVARGHKAIVEPGEIDPALAGEPDQLLPQPLCRASKVLLVLTRCLVPAAGLVGVIPVGASDGYSRTSSISI